MRHLTIVALLLLARADMTDPVSAQAGRPDGPPVRRRATEQALEGLIGTWILNMAKSRYAGPAPVSGGRSFEYTRDGLILCIYHTENADGTRRFGHWYSTLDGEEYNPDFLRRSGATPWMRIALKKVDEFSIDIRLKQHGDVVQTGSFRLASDGRTLTQTMTGINSRGEHVTNVAVFGKEP